LGYGFKAIKDGDRANLNISNVLEVCIPQANSSIQIHSNRLRHHDLPPEAQRKTVKLMALLD
jgi:guanyl-specific ribonuclease Sa